MILVITGKTASGKDTLIARILQKYPDFKKVLTSTSRAPREREQNSVDYNFISEPEFKQKITQGDFLEHVEYGGNYYGTEKSQINTKDNLIWKIDPSMAGRAKEMFPNSISLYITVDNQTILERLRERGLPKEEIAKRMQDDLNFWNQFKDQYDYTVENIPGNLQLTLDKIYEIIDSKNHPSVTLQP